VSKSQREEAELLLPPSEKVVEASSSGDKAMPLYAARRAMRVRAPAESKPLVFLKLDCCCCFGDCEGETRRWGDSEPRRAGDAGLRAGDGDGSGDRGRRARSTSTRSRRAGVRRAGGGICGCARLDGRMTTMGGGVVRACAGTGAVWWRRPLSCSASSICFSVSRSLAGSAMPRLRRRRSISPYSAISPWAAAPDAGSARFAGSGNTS
jgi:hypothetical protein